MSRKKLDEKVERMRQPRNLVQALKKQKMVDGDIALAKSLATVADICKFRKKR